MSSRALRFPRHRLFESPFASGSREVADPSLSLSGHRVAAAVAVSFAGIGLIWVMLTDIVLYRFVRDPMLLGRIETAKGWIFVAIASLFLYAITLSSLMRLSGARAVAETIVDSIADGVLLLGPKRTILHANPVAKRMLRHDHLAGMDAAEFSRRFRVSYPSGALVPPTRFASQRVFDEGGPLRYKAVLHPPGDADELVVSVTAAAVRGQPHQPPGIVVSVMHDITDAENFERMRDQFFAATAHSLKTPIAIIKANLRLLSASASKAAWRSAAAVERQCDRIDRLVQNLLVLARLRSESLQLFPDALDLGPLVEDGARELSGAFRRPIDVEIAAYPHVRGDLERLALVVRNIIDAAVRSSTPESKITVLLEQRDGRARVGVRYHALPPHERVGSLIAEHDDLGIARCVTEAIARAHGGTFREETDGVQTTSWLELPAMEGFDERPE